jgi:glutamate/tyrosine decarboxylase-like PLP-dependent enzyme
VTASYRQILEQLRQYFPQPVSDRVHDAYFVFTILRALDQIDGMKSKLPLLGVGGRLDYESALKSKIHRDPSTPEEVSAELVKQFEGLPVWGHPRTQINVVAPSSISSIIGSLLPSIYNPNLVSDETSLGVAVAETRATAIASDLIGYDPAKVGGVFTFGGTGTNLYGVKIGIEKAIPHAMERGVREDALVFASGQSHYSRLNITGWLGLGENSLAEIPTNIENDIRISVLTDTARQALADGKKIAAFIATMGTTDAFGLDDLEAIVALRDRLVDEFKLGYRPHVHADAVIGWAWSVFNDYDFDENPLGFRPRTLRALAGACRRISKLHLADSVGIDFHKTGFAPYVSSLFLCRDCNDLGLLARQRDKMPYLFQTGERHPGHFTLETSRSGSGILAALANLLLLGKNGMRALLGHLVEMAEALRENLEGSAYTTVLNGDNFGTVTLFRAYPDGVDTWTIKQREHADAASREQLLAHNEYNRKIYHYLHEQAMRGEGVWLSMTDCYRRTQYGAPIAALKSYIMSPFVDEEHVKLIVDKVLEAREKVSAAEKKGTTGSSAARP